MQMAGRGEGEGKTVEALPPLAVAFAAGIALARLYLAPVTWLAGFLLVLGSVTLWLGVRRKTVLGPMLAVFLLLGALSLRIAEREIHAPLENFLGRQVVLSGYVHRVQSGDDKRVVFLFQVEQAAFPGEEPAKVRSRIRVSVFRPPAALVLTYGQRLRLSGELVVPPGQRNPGGFNYASFLAGEGVSATFAVGWQAVEILPGRGGYFWLAAAEGARGRVKEALTRWLPPPEAGLAAGLLLGETEQLAVPTEEAYRLLGLTHLLSVSGVHTAFVAAFALLVTRRLRQKLLAAVLAAVLVLGYVLLTGGEAPVWRSAIMLWLVLAARHLGREGDGVRALAAAALLMLFFRPHWLFSLSFQLSFLATLGILLLTPRLQANFSRLPRFLAGPLAVTLGAQLAVLPLQLSLFSLLPLLSVPANLLCVPLVGVFMWLGLLALVAALFSPLLAAPFCLAAYPVLGALNELPNMLAALPFAAVRPPPLPPVVWAGYFLLLGLFAGGVKICWTRPRLVLAALVILNLAVFTPFWGASLGGGSGRPLEVVFLDVGQGLSVFIRTPAGQNILVDAGGGRPGSNFDPGERIVLPYLRSRRVASLDLLVLTHPSEDHHGGMPAVLSGIAVRRFASNGETDDNETFLAVRELLAAAAVPELVLSGGDRLLFGENVVLEVLSPPLEKIRHTVDDVNNNALVLRLSFRDFSLLLTSDAEREALDRLLHQQPGRLSADVLQVPHHGSRRAMSAALLEAVGAETAVISVGRNTYGHPHAEALLLLQQKESAIFRTDLHGAVTIRSDGSGWTVEPQLSPAASDGK
ncbi:MAG: DNA internalization-related competence protein ComEC/Rec2 [Dethiobacter sp.]|nr:DNA internalization-related competence protein ComEC/Rec2 [Dethiobacter sp.]MCL5980950.1 DNA internalization-related competence protein ComEC/Rec2 [Bacillota bacterium]